MWFLALKTLIADRGKLVTTLVGVVFSIVLVNVQGGLFLGLLCKASLLIDFGQADIWVGHRQMNNVDFPQDIPERWIHRVRAVPGVAAAEPYLVGHTIMNLPSGGFEQVVVVGCDPASLLGNAWGVTGGAASSIRHHEGIIVDRFEDNKLEFPRLGEVREVGGHRARIAGFSHGIVGFLVTPYVFCTYDRAAGYLRKPPEACSYFLVQLKPGTNATEVCREIVRRVPEVDACTRTEYAQRSVTYWMTRTGLGISFGAATLLGLLVGLVIVAQTLYASALDRLSEFGALKAMGAQDGQLYSLVLIQAASIALAGAIAGLQSVIFIQRTFSTPHAPIIVPWWLSIGSCGLVFAICLLASLLPYLRIRSVDPVMVLQT